MVSQGGGATPPPLHLVKMLKTCLYDGGNFWDRENYALNEYLWNFAIIVLISRVFVIIH